MLKTFFPVLIAILLGGTLASQATPQYLQSCETDYSIPSQEQRIFGGTVLLEESFEDQFPPQDWNVLSLGTAARTWQPTDARARTGNYSAVMYWVQEEGTTDEWLVTKAIDMSGVQGARLIFYESERYWSYGKEHSIKVSTTSQDDPAAFETVKVWTPENHSIEGFDGKATEVDLSAYAGNATVYIAFCYSTEVADYWFIDDISVVEPLDHDVRANNLTLEDHVEGGKMSLVQGSVENIGLNAESVTVEFGYLEWDSSFTVKRTKTVDALAAGEQKTVSFGFYSFPKNVEYTYFIRVVLDGDMDESNNTAFKASNTFEQTRDVILIEKATGTWCVYCPGSAVCVEKLYEDFPGKVVAIEYHGGDPYEHPEGRERINFYRVTGYPTAIFNGYSRIIGGSSSTAWRDLYARYRTRYFAALGHPTCFSLDMTYSETGDRIRAKAEITCSAKSYLRNYRIFYAITESHISQRWFDLDSLQHVSRGLYPNTEGEPFIFDEYVDDGKVFTNEIEFDWPDNVVRENCEVIAYIQNMDSKMVMAVDVGEKVEKSPAFTVTGGDSILSGETGGELVYAGVIHNATDDTLDIFLKRTVNDIPEDWTSSLCFELCLAPFLDLAEGTVPPNGDLEFSIHVFTGAVPDTGSIAFEISDKAGATVYSNSFTAMTQWPTGIESKNKVYQYQLFGAYPNPFNPGTTIEYSVAQQCKSAKLQVYSVRGRLAAEKSLSGLARGVHRYNFDGSALAGGVYLYRILYETNSGTLSSQYKKFTLLK